MTPLLILLPGHGWRPHWDPGAVSGRAIEAHLCRAYPALVGEGVRAEGWQVETRDTGDYPDRDVAAKAARVAAGSPLTVIGLCHVNSCAGRPSLVGHLEESHAGGRLALILAEHLSDRLPDRMADPTRPLAYLRAWRDLPADGPEAWKRNGRRLQEPSYNGSGPKGCGILLEPWTVQQAADLDGETLVDLLAATAGAIVAGLVEWEAEVANATR